MVLQNVEDLSRSRDGNTCVLPLLRRLEVDHQAQLLHTSRHQIHDPLNHVEQMVNLPWTGIRVPPNLSKILTEWGLLEEQRANSIPCRDLSFNDSQ